MNLSKTHPLSCFFKPQSIAVIGAKNTPNTVGRTIMANLTSSGFEGRIIPVNPHHDEVFGIPCFKSVIDVPPQIDLAVIAVPANNVPDVMKTCGVAKIPAAIIISAGFGEMGEEGKKLEREVLSIAQSYSTRIIGPNCLGLMNPVLGINATFARGMARIGTLAFISQSGALCTAVLDWSAKEEIGFSSFVSVGDMLDVCWGDLIEYFGEDPATKSILMYMESVPDPRSFLGAAKEVSWRKPIIVIKPGRSEEGAHAAQSHTGALVGSDEVFDAACERAGILRVDQVEQVFDMAEVLARQPRPSGPRLSIVTNAGGPAVLATDALIMSGGSMAHLSDGTISALSSFLPHAWSHGNPVDILGDASPDVYKKTMETVLKDSGTDGVLAILTPQDMTNPSATAQAISSLSASNKKPVITSWMGGEAVEEGKRILTTFGIPSFAYPDNAAWTFSMMWKLSKMIEELFVPPRRTLKKKMSELSVRRENVLKLIEGNEKVLSERISKKILSLYGFPVVEAHLATTEEEACACARSLGFPVVLKAEVEIVTHKTEVNGVQLRLQDEPSVRKAFKKICTSIKERFGEDTLVSVTVQKMIEKPGIELIVGSKRDSQFGQVILFGAGGIHVEIFKDRSLGIPPLTSVVAKNMIEKTKIVHALQSVQKGEMFNQEVLENFLIQFSDMIIENPEIEECDINPLLVTSSGLFCLDARIIIGKNNIVPNAIPPYRKECIREVVDKGTTLRVRPVRPEDALMFMSFHERLSNLSLYRDMFAFSPFPEKLPLDNLLHICHMENRIVHVVESEAEENEIIGIAHMTRFGKGGKLFLAYLPNERVGELLLSSIKEVGKKEGFQYIYTQVKATNRPLITLLSTHGFVEDKKTESFCYIYC